MGALHDGHLSLIRAARSECDFAVVSIFVNPLQFGPAEDLNVYPRTIEKDLQACQDAGVDLVFTPTVEEMYPSGQLTTVRVALLSERLCGLSRPAHYDGVCTVVAKLFNIVQPHCAYFGEKDFQQLVVIRQMTRDLNMSVDIVPCPIVRDQDGLAMSSRNAYLKKDERRRATCLYHALVNGISGRYQHPGDMIDAMRRQIESQGPNEIDYIRIVDPQTLQDVDSLSRPARICLAVNFDRTRLIDNMEWLPPESGPNRNQGR